MDMPIEEKFYHGSCAELILTIPFGSTTTAEPAIFVFEYLPLVKKQLLILLKTHWSYDMPIHLG